jgi:PD-(D/E)XK nuclease superfamily
MGRVLHTALAAGASFGADEMTYSYTQISRYLRCPRHYRRRCLDGWREKDTRAAMVFGRAFEKALSAYFLQKDAAAVLFRQWAAYQNNSLEYANSDSWERMLHQGIQLLERFAQDDRVRIRQPRRNLQVKFTRPVSGKNVFVAYIDALGELDGKWCLLEWKTASSRYQEEHEGLLAPDPQLVCYSWITGVADVAQVVFVRKQLVEIQYLHTSITHLQRQEFGQLVEDTLRQLEACEFPHNSGIPVSTESLH